MSDALQQTIIDGLWATGSFVLALTMLAVVMATLYGAFEVIRRFARADDPPTDTFDLSKNQTLRALVGLLIGVGALLYVLIVMVLVFSLFGLVLHLMDIAIDAEDAFSKIRDDVIRIAALTATLGAVIALPFTVRRLQLTQKQTDTATETLFNQKIDSAVSELHAQRQVTKAVAPGGSYEKHQDFYEDDFVRRNAAMDRLVGLATEYGHRYGAAPRIARLLSVYVRELSRSYPAKKPPERASPEYLGEWLTNLVPARPDMQTAVQTLGRIRPLLHDNEVRQSIDLTKCNLQAYDLTQTVLSNAKLERAALQKVVLSGADLQGANLLEADIVGANLSWAELRGAILYKAKLQEALLFGANLQNADLSGAKLQWAFLTGAKLQGANLSGAEFDTSTDLTGAILRGAWVREVDFTNVPQIEHFLQDVFGDNTTKLPDGIERPNNLTGDFEILKGFENQEAVDAWRAWQRDIGFDPENPDA